MSKSQSIDMTQGPPLRIMLAFTLPLVLANLGQQLYSVIDAVIVGRFVGVRAFAAVGASDWAYFLPLWSIASLTQGFAIPLAQAFGEKNDDRLRKIAGNIIKLSILLALILVVVFELFSAPCLRALRTPDPIFPEALLYLRIMYLGIPVIFIYNMGAGALRALGDGKSPLVAIAVAAVSNISLDLLFVLVFHWGIAGAAAASVLAQMMAGLYCLFRLRALPQLRLRREDYRWDRRAVFESLRLGLTLFFQHALVAVGGMILQSSINNENLAFIAGFTATNKIYGLLESCGISVGYACTTYAAQNYGARSYARIRSGLCRILLAAVFISALISLFSFLAGPRLLSLFIDRNQADTVRALAVACRYLYVIAGLLSLLYVLFVTRSSIQGLGQVSVPLLAGLAEFFARSFVALPLYNRFGADVLFFAEPAAWIAALLPLVPCFFYSLYKIKQREAVPPSAEWN